MLPCSSVANVPVWDMFRLLHQSRDHVPKLQQGFVDVLGFCQRQPSGASFGDAFAAGQVTQGQLADRPHPRGGIGGGHLDDEETVAPTAMRIDIMAPNCSVFKAVLHDLKDLLWRCDLCGQHSHHQTEPLRMISKVCSDNATSADNTHTTRRSQCKPNVDVA